MNFKESIPGVILLVVIGCSGRIVEFVFGLNHLLAAIVLGVLIGNTYGVPNKLEPGVQSYKLWLEAGIVLLGAGIVLDHVVEVGPVVLLLVMGVVVGTVLVTELLAWVFGVAPKLGSLLASGSGVCGVSAVISVASGISATKAHIAYASATILLFDGILLVLYPALGRLLGLPDFVYGVWVGTTMFSTGPATAAGFAYSSTAGEWAVLTKLTRNSFIGAFALIYAIRYTRASADSREASGWSNKLPLLWKDFPTFFIGFFLFLVLGNTVLGSSTVNTLGNASSWLFLFAFAGLGLELKLETLRNSGVAPIITVCITLLVFSVLTLTILLLLF